jgi:ABC-type nickel/cobalt efflux system permease component RcnA
MVPDILAVLGVGGLLGFRHAFEPDHLAAVSTLATRHGRGEGGEGGEGGSRWWSAARLGLAWGVGHTATVGAVTLLVGALGVRLPAALWPAAELAVAALLVLLGATVVWRYARGRWHMHLHTHATTPDGAHFHLHSHADNPGHGHAHAAADARRSLGFGVAHGLAGSGAIAVLLVAAAADGATRLAYFAALGAGTMLGMLTVSLALGGLVRLAATRGTRWATVLHLGSALASVVAGVVLAWRVMWD